MINHDKLCLMTFVESGEGHVKHSFAGYSAGQD